MAPTTDQEATMDGSILYRGGAEYTDFDPDVLADLRIDAILAEIAGAGGRTGKSRKILKTCNSGWP